MLEESDRHDFQIDMTDGQLINEKKFVARLRKRKYQALQTALIRADIAITAANSKPDSDPRKVPTLVRITRQRELVSAEMKRRRQGGYAPPPVIVGMKPAVIGSSVKLGNKR
jgi:hypothetical protein